MKINTQLSHTLAAGILMFAGATRTNADAVVDWNAIALQTVASSVPPRPPPIAFLDLATVHAAVYDAVQAIDQRFEPYAVQIPGASGSPAVAAAKAAHDVLTNRFPGQAASLDTAYRDYLTSHDLAEADPGVAVGQAAAAGIIALRANDGTFPPNVPAFTGGTEPGVWRPTPSYNPGPPPSLASMAVPWLATVTPFTLESPAQFRVKPPPGLRSKRYAKDYNEVKALGALVNSARTPEQTDLAYFWADNFLAQWNRGIRALADAHVQNIGDSARLFALTSLATADAGITAWDCKVHYVFWRPLTAIQEGDNDGNRHTDGDPTWQPLLNTPNYPDYTSGANNITGAFARALALFFGRDKMTFSLTSNNPLVVKKTHTYERFSDAAQEVVDVRIYHGLHFRFADTAARSQGRDIAQWVFENYLQPIDSEDDDRGKGHHHRRKPKKGH